LGFIRCPETRLQGEEARTPPKMSGFIDLHCHWLPGVDDGAATLTEANDILGGLRTIGFARVFATPHMRPGLFDNSAEELRDCYRAVCGELSDNTRLPELALGAEHFYDDVNHRRLLSGHALPYPGERAALIEFRNTDFPHRIEEHLAELGRARIRPVIAHPERYRPLWESPAPLENLLDVGAATLLDVAALVGKYGAKAKRTAEALLDLGLYHAACTDTHHPKDLRDVDSGLSWIAKHYGDDELSRLFIHGPLCLLAGDLPD
jgi:protein-tyrosine phosphatase